MTITIQNFFYLSVKFISQINLTIWKIFISINIEKSQQKNEINIKNKNREEINDKKKKKKN